MGGGNIYILPTLYYHILSFSSVKCNTFNSYADNGVDANRLMGQEFDYANENQVEDISNQFHHVEILHTDIKGT